MIKQRKRFVDSALLNAGFFLKLTTDERLFWLMLQLKCDTIGQFEMEGELLFAERMHGLDVDPKALQKKVNQKDERLRNLGNGNWFLTQFIREQYGRLNPNSPPHKRYIKDLKETGLWNAFINENPDLKPADRVSKDYPYPNATPEEEEEEKEEETEEDQEEEKDEESPLEFEMRQKGMLKGTPF